MRIVLASMPRSGSEFVVKLTKKMMGDRFPSHLLSFTPGRIIQNHSKPNELKNLIQKGIGIDYFKGKENFFFKIESPGNDSICMEIATEMHDVKWIASMRKIEKIIISHHNLITWGWPEKKIVNAFKNDLEVYIKLQNQNNLFIVNIDDPKRFNVNKMMDFLGVEKLNSDAEDFINKWYIVNPLKKQKEKAGEKIEERIEPKNISTLRTRYPWINEEEKKMYKLWKKCI